MRFLLSFRLTLLLLLILSGASAQEVTDTFYVNKDAFVNSAATSTNYGSDADLKVFQDTGATVNLFRSYLQFDLSSIPTGALITSATLYLIPDSINNGANHPLYVQRVDTTDWSEGAVNWSNQPPVYTSDQVSATHAQTTSTTLHSFNVKNHVQNFVYYPYNNNGWRIRLQDESESVDFGLMYHSSEASNVSHRPYLQVKYIMPVHIQTDVSHCTPGNNDASVNVTLSSGSGTYGYYWWMKESNTGVLTTIEQGNTVNNSTIDIASLEPGVYIFRVRDAKWNADNDNKYYFYKRVLIGREGDTTAVTIMAISYMEDAQVNNQKIAGTDNDNLNSGNNIYMTATYTAMGGSGAVYDTKGLLKYYLDFDTVLKFDTTDLYLRTQYGHYRYWTSTNEGYLRRVTSPWEEMVVTWNNQPTVTTEDQVYIQQTHTANGYGYAPDTLNIKDFIDYWQMNPDENYGMEIVLADYGQTYGARQGWSQSEAGLNYVTKLRLTYSIPPQMVNAEITVSETSDSIKVTTRDGYPPFTYLWSNGARTEDLAGAADGIYWLKITDDEGNLVKYQISKDDHALWDSLDCTDDSLTYIQYLDSCHNDSTGVAYASGQVIESTANSWLEVQLVPESTPRSFGFAVVGEPVNRTLDLAFGFYMDENENLFMIRNAQIYGTAIPYNKNDILKLEKKHKVISYQVNGVEHGYYDFSKVPFPDYIPVAILTNQAYYREIRHGDSPDELESLPCDISFGGVDLDEYGNPIFNFCTGEESLFDLPSGYYYRWFPEVGLTCYDCPDPVVMDASIAGNTYSLSVYHSYSDYLDGTPCKNSKVTFVLDQTCDGECTPVVQIIPELESYCAGDVIQFNIDLDDALHVVISPDNNFNCSSCLDPQYIVGTSGETVTFDFYNVPVETEGAEACESIPFEIVINASCHEDEGASFNNYGAAVWVEKNATENTYLNIHCNFLNEKVMLTVDEEDVVINGRFVNEGFIFVRNNWTHNAENKVFNETEIEIDGHGEEFEEGVVELFGGYQMVKGVSSTRFYHLNLTGSDKKELFINTYACQTLNLNHLELATRNNTMFVTNPVNTAITNLNYGFISSNLEGGYLHWEMENGSVYFVPLGSSIGGFRYKPMEVTTADDIFVKLRLVNHNPAYDNLEEKAIDVAVVNDQYYYYIIPEETDQIEKLAFHYHTITDGDYQHIAHWDNVWAPLQLPLEEPWWEKTTTITLASPSPTYPINNQVVSTEAWESFNGKEFVLAMAGFVIDWEDFGDSGDEENEGGGVIIEVISVGGTSTGGDLGDLYGAGGDFTGDNNTYTPSPVEGTYQINVSSTCGTDGIIEFTVDQSGNVEENSIYYVLPGAEKYPLSEELYDLGVTGGTGGTGLFSLFSVPEQNYLCDNGIKINLSSGIILDENETIEITLVPGITVTSIVVKDNDGVTVTPAATTAVSWTAPTMDPGIYRIEVVLDDGGSPVTLNGVFILKNI